MSTDADTTDTERVLSMIDEAYRVEPDEKIVDDNVDEVCIFNLYTIITTF